MSTELHCYDYVNQPFELVRSAVLADTQALLKRATSRGGNSKLHVGLLGLEIGAEIETELGTVLEHQESPQRPTTTIELAWRSRRGAAWFPVMNAHLAIYPLSPTETQLELSGTYKPPLGLLGDAVDAVALRRIAQEAVATFVREVATHLRANLAAVHAPA